MRIGSLCSGAGMLDAAVANVVGGRPAWFADDDPAASKVLAHRHPGVPNHGDITAVDWAGVQPVDVLTAGFPCQDVSAAGRRAGIRPGNRSGVWTWCAHVIATVRPRLVVIENVGGLLHASAHSEMEPCPWCLGNEPGQPALRACGAVLGDLADLGFDAEWVGVRASDVGAAHQRLRVFILGWPAGDRPARRRRPGGRVDGPDPLTLLPTPAARDWKSGRSNVMDRNARPLNEVITNLLPTLAARLGDRRGAPNADTAQRRMWDEGRRNLEDAVALLPTPRATDGTNGGPNQRGSSGDLMLPSAVINLDRWGQYAPAIARWEAVVGRRAPDPTEPGAKGQARLSARFVEWLMGWPEGWVTDVPGVSRNDQLRILGNGVVPQQAAHAVATLLERAGTDRRGPNA